MREYTLCYDCVKKTIDTSGGPLHASFQKIPCTNILILVDDALACGRPYPGGTVFVPNAQLATDTGNKITHMAYTRGLYEAFRGGTHTVRHGGALPEHEWGEIPNLQDDIATARAYVGALIASGMLTADEEKELRNEQARLVRRYDTKRNAFKTKARDQMERGLKTVDTRGRRNPMAAGFATGGAIGKLLARQKQVRVISAAVNSRTIHIYGAIETNMDLFVALRGKLKPSRKKLDGTFSIPGELEALMRQDCGSKEFFTASDRLRELATTFELVRALPFRTNAALTAQGLRQAAACAYKKDREGTLALYKRIRQGIAWTFALHTFEQTVLAPLSYLMEEYHGKISFTVAPSRLSRIIAALRDFSGRLAHCSDVWPKVPRKAAITGYIETAETLITLDNWLSVKKALRSASALM